MAAPTPPLGSAAYSDSQVRREEQPKHHYSPLMALHLLNLHLHRLASLRPPELVPTTRTRPSEKREQKQKQSTIAEDV